LLTFKFLKTWHAPCLSKKLVKAHNMRPCIYTYIQSLKVMLTFKKKTDQIRNMFIEKKIKSKIVIGYIQGVRKKSTPFN